MLFDTHAHYDDARFDMDRHEVIDKAHECGVDYILNASTDLKSLALCIELADKYDYIFIAVGIHPHNVEEMGNDTLDSLAALSSDKKVVAIGEIGLDYFYDNAPREMQKCWFIKQIGLARSLKLPMIIHNRDSHEDVMKIIKKEDAKSIGGVFHCYSGSVEMAKEVLKNNFYISTGGAVTFKNARRLHDVLKYIPDDMLLVETDCPYMTPVPYRGKRNDSRYLKLIIDKIAEIRGKTYEEIADLTTKNAKNLFKIN